MELLDNSILFKTVVLAEGKTISGNSQLVIEANSDANKIDGYTMKMAIGVCYKNNITTGNFTNTLVMFYNNGSSAVSTNFLAMCVYTKDVTQ